MTPHEIKLAQTAHPIHSLLSQRWSPRAFDTHPVERVKLLALFEAARWAASSGNGQPWSFLIATAEQGDEFQRLLACLDDSNQSWAQHAPVIGVAVAQVQRNDKPSRLAFFDLGLAMQNLVIQAMSLDLHVHMMAGFSQEKVRAAYHLPDTHETAAAFVVGYLGDPATLDERNRQRELTTRVRKPIKEFVFSGDWAVPSSLLE